MSKKWKPPFEKKDLQARLFIVCSYDSDNKEYIKKIKHHLEAFFGKIDFEIQFTPLIPIASQYFSNKEYDIYHLLSFERPIVREEIVDIRLKTLQLETKFQKDGFPVVELDPGYVTSNQVVRTSLFEDKHKIYLYKKIYSETLFYFEKGSFKPFIHTPKFFRSHDITTTFNDLRLIYVNSET